MAKWTYHIHPTETVIPIAVYRDGSFIDMDNREWFSYAYQAGDRILGGPGVYPETLETYQELTIDEIREIAPLLAWYCEERYMESGG